MAWERARPRCSRAGRRARRRPHPDGNADRSAAEPPAPAPRARRLHADRDPAGISRRPASRTRSRCSTQWRLSACARCLPGRWLTRNNDYLGVAEMIREAGPYGEQVLNGFPVVNHGVAGLRKAAAQVGLPVQTRHSTRDAAPPGGGLLRRRRDRLRGRRDLLQPAVLQALSALRGGRELAVRRPADRGCTRSASASRSTASSRRSPRR